jgi:hypothetical protein
MDRFLDILAFDTSADATAFLSAFGIEIDESDDSYFDVAEGRAIFGFGGSGVPNPDSLPLGRSLWMEQKTFGRMLGEVRFCYTVKILVNIGFYISSLQVLCNGPCERVHLPSPIDSFDADGRYVKDPFNSPSNDFPRYETKAELPTTSESKASSSASSFAETMDTDRKPDVVAAFAYGQPPAISIFGSRARQPEGQAPKRAIFASNAPKFEVCLVVIFCCSSICAPNASFSLSGSKHSIGKAIYQFFLRCAKWSVNSSGCQALSFFCISATNVWGSTGACKKQMADATIIVSTFHQG